MNFRWKIAQAAEIRWWQRYLKNKNTAEYAVWKADYWKKLLKEIDLSALENSVVHAPKILDAGCGPAGIFMVLSPQNEVTALDPLLNDYEKKLPHFKKEYYPAVNFLSQSLESYHSNNKNFDFVFCLNAINHVSDLNIGIDNLIQMTKPGGTLIISIDAHRSRFLKYIFSALPGDVLHPHQYTLNEYRRMFQSRGCAEVKLFLKKEELIFNYYILVLKKFQSTEEGRGAETKICS